MDKLFDKIKEAGKTSSNSLTDVILKAIEELGEVSAEDLRVREKKKV